MTLGANHGDPATGSGAGAVLADYSVRAQASGLTGHAYFQRHGLAESAYHYWQSELRGRDPKRKPNSDLCSNYAVDGRNLTNFTATCELRGLNNLDLVA